MRKFAGLLLLGSAAALAQPVDDGSTSAGRNAQGDVAVTIYNNNLALVQDRRELSLPAGRSRQEFPDVSAQIRPETVTLSGSGLGVVEQNFDFDLLSPAALMQKAVGETITIVRTNPASGAETRERATVLSANNGVVLRIGNRIEVLRDDGIPTRVIFDKVPDNLRPRPTLSVTVEAARGGRQPVTLTYLTPGLGWSADYVALFDEAAGKMDVQGWITLTNSSGTPFANANTLLVAGAVGQAGQQRYDRGYYPPPPPPPPGAMRNPGTETAGRERLGDFYLYPLPERTTIANAQTKQVSFLDVGGAPALRAYEYRNPWMGSADQPTSANSVLRFSLVARRRARRRAPRRHRPCLPARRARRPAVRRRKRDRPHPDGLRTRSRHGAGVRHQGPADGRKARADQHQPALAHRNALSADQRQPAPGHGRFGPGGAVGRHADRRRK